MEKLFDGDVTIWIDQEVIMLKAVGKFGDPIELNETMAEELAARLIEYAKRIDG